MNDEIFMREALRIAKNAEGRTSPNPLVGAVVVKDGKIIAEGWHRQAGTQRAQRFTSRWSLAHISAGRRLASIKLSNRG